MRFSLLLALLCVVAAFAAVNAMHLEDGWVAPEFVDFLEMEQELPTWLTPKKPAVAAPAAPRPAAPARPAVAPATARPASAAPATTPQIPYPTNALFLPDPNAADLADDEVTYDSVVPEVKPAFYEDTNIRRSELQVKYDNTPSIPYAPVPQDTTVVSGGWPLVKGAAPAATPNFLLGNVGAAPAASNRQVVSSTSSGLCGSYVGSAVMKISGNDNVQYDVVKILAKHSQNPASLSKAPSASDNTIRTVTACAFDKMYEAAKKAGVTLLIGSGFRTLGRQQYFWNCHISKKCNKGRLAARPGTSNHGRGLALDLNQASPGVYRWLAANAQTYGFVRTVRTERWHWEYRPGAPKAPYTGTK